LDDRPLTVKVGQRSPPPYIERPHEPVRIAPLRFGLITKVSPATVS
jgi:hypothetical protein